jgi:hypothetical protein
MVFVDLQQQLLIVAQVQPLLQRMQKLVPVSPEYVISLVSLPHRIAPSSRPFYSRTSASTSRRMPPLTALATPSNAVESLR